MRYIGADVHKNYTVFAVLTQEGKVEQRTRIENNPETLREFLGGLPKPAHLVVEAGYHWQPFYEVVEELDLAVSHAARGSSQLGALYQRVARRGGRNAAKMAVARQMLMIVHRILVRGEPFRDRNHGRPSPYSF